MKHVLLTAACLVSILLIGSIETSYAENGDDKKTKVKKTVKVEKKVVPKVDAADSKTKLDTVKKKGDAKVDKTKGDVKKDTAPSGTAATPSQAGSLEGSESNCRTQAGRCPELEPACASIGQIRTYIKELEAKGIAIHGDTVSAQGVGHDAGGKILKGKLTAAKLSAAKIVKQRDALVDQFKEQCETAKTTCEKRDQTINIDCISPYEQAKKESKDSDTGFMDIVSGAGTVLGALSTGAQLGQTAMSLLEKLKKCDEGEKASCRQKVFCEDGEDEEGNPKFKAKFINTRDALELKEGCFLDKPPPPKPKKDEKQPGSDEAEGPELSEGQGVDLADQAQEGDGTEGEDDDDDELSDSESVGADLAGARDPSSSGGLVSGEGSDESLLDDEGGDVADRPIATAEGEDGEGDIGFKGGTTVSSRSKAFTSKTLAADRLGHLPESKAKKEETVLKEEFTENDEIIFKQVETYYDKDDVQSQFSPYIK